VPSYAVAERAAIADLLTELGPDQPTLCTGWTTRDLAAHIIARERRPDAAPGILLKAVAPHLKRVQNKIALRPWPELITTLRRRSPWLIFGDELVNRTEFFVHHEDIRRAQPQWQPRVLGDDYEAALFGRVRAQARLVLRRTPAEVTVAAQPFGAARGGKGGPAVTLSGAPQELLLFLMGRQAHARVELSGPEEITNRMRGARYGI
jgi:uncharacterized protein (TIGR03085 family)